MCSLHGGGLGNAKPVGENSRQETEPRVTGLEKLHPHSKMSYFSHGRQYST